MTQKKSFNIKSNAPQQYFLFPSNLYISRVDTDIMTILGSCVAVCIWDPVTQIGGMNHFMLPLWNGKGLASPKYGNIATKRLIQKLEHKGVRVSNMQAKVFGGGEVLETKGNNFLIGQRNVAIAFEILEEYGIRLISSSVNGKRGRKIIFNTKTGKVRLHFIKQSNNKV